MVGDVGGRDDEGNTVSRVDGFHQLQNRCASRQPEGARQIPSQAVVKTSTTEWSAGMRQFFSANSKIDSGTTVTPGSRTKSIEMCSTRRTAGTLSARKSLSMMSTDVLSVSCSRRPTSGGARPGVCSCSRCAG